MRRRIARLVSVVTLLWTLAACGPITQAAQSVVVRCPDIDYQEVAWSPDGKTLAFIAGSGSQNQLLLINLNDGVIKQLTADNYSYKAFIHWMPDGYSLDYLEPSGPALFRIGLGGVGSQVNVPTDFVGSYAWSADGVWLAYSSPKPASTEWDIYVVRADGRDNRLLTTSVDAQSALAWSPDGTRIAFLQNNTVYTMRADDGTDKRRISEGGGPIRYSPDGAWLSFFTYGTPFNGLIVAHSDGSGQGLITTDTAFKDYSWLPDSQHISYVSLPPSYALSVIDIKTLAVETLTTIKVFSTAPAWSPDGSQVAFVGDNVSNPNAAVQEIYLMNRDGTGLVRLTDNPGKRYCLHWPF